MAAIYPELSEPLSSISLTLVPTVYTGETVPVAHIVSESCIHWPEAFVYQIIKNKYIEFKKVGKK